MVSCAIGLRLKSRFNKENALRRSTWCYWFTNDAEVSFSWWHFSWCSNCQRITTVLILLFLLEISSFGKKLLTLIVWWYILLPGSSTSTAPTMFVKVADILWICSCEALQPIIDSSYSYNSLLEPLSISCPS